MAETSTTTYMSLTLPTPGERLGPTWASDLNAALTLVDAHDHATSGKSLGVAALTVDANIDFSPGTTDYAPTNMKFGSFASQAAALSAASFPSSIYVAAGDLYYNDLASNQVRITDGGVISSTGVAAIAFSAASSSLSGTASITATDNISYYFIDTSATACTLTLPSAGAAGMTAGRFFVVKDISGNAATNNITITASGTDQIDGAGTYVISSNRGSATVINRGNTSSFDIV
tara:strand:- start:3200 stop:3895 length:696 start_codon:yes stop_codon:yes gene_type:complete